MKANIARPIDRTQRAYGSDKKGKPYKEAKKEQTKKEGPTKRQEPKNEDPAKKSN